MPTNGKIQAEFDKADKYEREANRLRKTDSAAAYVSATLSLKAEMRAATLAYLLPLKEG